MCTPGRLWGWALGLGSGVGHDSGVGHSGRLWGWALQGVVWGHSRALQAVSGVGHSNKVSGGTPGSLWGWALQAVSRSRPGEEKSSGRLPTPHRRWGKMWTSWQRQAQEITADQSMILTTWVMNQSTANISVLWQRENNHAKRACAAARRVWVFGFWVWGLGFKVKGLGFRVWGLGFRVKGLGFRV